LGLGLAMVARIVRNMDGQLRLKSEEGKGSRFVIQLPFSLPDNESSSENDDIPALSRVPTGNEALITAPPRVSEGEVTLIDKVSSLSAEGITRQRSAEEVTSLHSYKSGSSNKSNRSAKSDVDRLIDAIATPLAVGEPEDDDRSLQRANSIGSGHSRKNGSSVTNATSSRGSISSKGRLGGPGTLKRAR
jgi:hypothetical protein